MNDFPYIWRLLFTYFLITCHVLKGWKNWNPIAASISSWPFRVHGMHPFNILAITGSENAGWHAVKTVESSRWYRIFRLSMYKFLFFSSIKISLSGKTSPFALFEWNMKIILCSLVLVHLGFWSNSAMTYLGTREKIISLDFSFLICKIIILKFLTAIELHDSLNFLASACRVYLQCLYYH